MRASHDSTRALLRRISLHSFGFLHWWPRLIRVETLHFLEFRKRLLSQVFLVDNPVMAHKEALHARYPVLGRRRQPTAVRIAS